MNCFFISDLYFNLDFFCEKYRETFVWKEKVSIFASANEK